MPILFDYHLHSTHSGDGLSTDRVQVLAAIDRGLKEICFTEHLDIDFPVNVCFQLHLDTYQQDIRALAEEFKDQITIKCGVEVGNQKHRGDIVAKTRQWLKGYSFDYVLSSVHWLSGCDYHSPEGWQGVTRSQVFREYLSALYQCALDYTDFNCLGHITYYSRYCPLEEKEMVLHDAPEELEALFKLLISRGQGIEINTSVYDKSGFFLPDLDIVRFYRQLGGEIISIGSDSHIGVRTGANIHAGLQMLKAAGFDHVCTFTNRQPVFNRI